MTPEHKKELAAGGILAAIVALLLLLSHKAAAQGAAPAFPSFGGFALGPAPKEQPLPDFNPKIGTLHLPTVGQPPVPTNPPGSEPAGAGCHCGGTCAANPNQIPTLNKIISIGNAAAASIQQAGVATLQAIAAQNTNPLLNIQIVPSSNENVQLSMQ